MFANQVKELQIQFGGFLINVCFNVVFLSSIIKNKEALSEIMQDFKYDSEESD